METRQRLERQIVGEDLARFALNEVGKRYGKRPGDGVTPLAYHNFHHSLGVVKAGEAIAISAANRGKINKDDVVLVKIAASFHDIEQGLGGGMNEQESARIAEGYLRKKGVFNEEDIAKVKRMIMATVVDYSSGWLKQSATDDYLTQILADADLSSLGAKPDIYWGKAESLLKELKKTDSPNNEDLRNFLGTQDKFLENHKFYTDEANILFPHKKENIEFTHKLLAEISPRTSD